MSCIMNRLHHVLKKSNTFISREIKVVDKTTSSVLLFLKNVQHKKLEPVFAHQLERFSIMFHYSLSDTPKVSDNSCQKCYTTLLARHDVVECFLPHVQHGQDPAKADITRNNIIVGEFVDIEKPSYGRLLRDIAVEVQGKHKGEGNG